MEAERVRVSVDRDWQEHVGVRRCETADFCRFQPRARSWFVRPERWWRISGPAYLPSARPVRGSRRQYLGDRFPQQDNKGHTVTKFSPDGKVLMTLARPASLMVRYVQRVNTLVAPNGDIFVADGHGGDQCTDREVHWDGKFIKAGKQGTCPASRHAHMLAMIPPAGCSWPTA
jgi:hypothetical protein